MADRRSSGLGWAVEALLLAAATLLALIAVVAFDASEPALIGDPRPDGWQLSAMVGWLASGLAVGCVVAAALRRPVQRWRQEVKREQELSGSPNA